MLGPPLQHHQPGGLTLGRALVANWSQQRLQRGQGEIIEVLGRGENTSPSAEGGNLSPSEMRSPESQPRATPSDTVTGVGC